MKVSHRRLTDVTYVLTTDVSSRFLGLVAAMRLLGVVSRAMYALCHLESRERHALPSGYIVYKGNQTRRVSLAQLSSSEL
jgi:hypothetical protein